MSPSARVVELRQFVDAQLAEDATDAGHTIVIDCRPARFAVALGVVAHAAELDDAEETAYQDRPLPAVEDRENPSSAQSESLPAALPGGRAAAGTTLPTSKTA